jgi:hypothetical protein
MHCSVENLCTRWTGPSRTLWPLCTRCKRQPKRGCPTARRSTTLRTRGEVIPSAFCAVESCFAARCGVRHSSYCQLPDRLTTRTLDASAARHKPARLREQHSMKPMRNPRRTCICSKKLNMSHHDCCLPLQLVPDGFHELRTTAHPCTHPVQPDSMHGRCTHFSRRGQRCSRLHTTEQYRLWR